MDTHTLPPDETSIALAAGALREGRLVAIPTETVYGLAGCARDEHAVAAIFATKERPTFDPLIVHVGAPRDWDRLGPAERFAAAAAREVFDAAPLGAAARERVARLMEVFWPGPLTLVLPRGGGIPLLVTSGLDTVAVRMPRHAVTQALLARVGAPLAAPSANRFGRISPTSAADVRAELDGRIPFILDGGPCPVGVESTIVEIRGDGGLTLLRPGGVPAASIARVAGVMPASRPRERGPVPAPGMLDSHYAPAAPLVLLGTPLPDVPPDAVLRHLRDGRNRLGVLRYSGHTPVPPRWRATDTTVETLSEAGDPEEAARHLFGALRRLDAAAPDVIAAEPCPTEEGLGYAINDRLRRASSR